MAYRAFIDACRIQAVLFALTDTASLDGARSLIERMRSEGIHVALLTLPPHSTRSFDDELNGLFDLRFDECSAEFPCHTRASSQTAMVHAAARIGSAPAFTAVFADTAAHVAAAQAATFGLVIGIDRSSGALHLQAHDASAVISSFEQVGVLGRPGIQATADVPQALNEWDALWRTVLCGRPLAMFLDYDGTLTPIVRRPEAALLAPQMRDRITRLAQYCPVAIVSGRDASFVREHVGVANAIYLGSHGLDAIGPAGPMVPFPVPKEVRAALAAAEGHLRARLGKLEGIEVERKRYAIAVHYRNAARDVIPRALDAVQHETALWECLYMTHGKKVLELRPDIAWDKGKAVRWALKTFTDAALSTQELVPVYIGDDLTDEDAFRELAPDGLTVLVSSEKTRQTWARARVGSVHETGKLLDSIINYAKHVTSHT